VFHPWPSGASGYPPEHAPIPSETKSDYWPRNYGEEDEQQLPGAPPGPYRDGLHEVLGTNPNGIWRLYIYDDSGRADGVLERSWRLKLYFW